MKLYVTERKTFPDPRLTLDEGILDMSDDLRVERLLEAYSFGIFPWPHDDLPTLWFSPEQRGILEFKDIHIPRTIQKLQRKHALTYSMNREFDAVLDECARAPRPGQSGTWITSKVARAYKEFHRAGYAHSIEAWNEGRLVGGLYGVYVAGVFCGESMFFKESGASKLTLLRLVEFLRAQGLGWMDIQMVTPLLEQLGGKYISRGEFLRRLEAAKKSARPIEFKI